MNSKLMKASLAAAIALAAGGGTFAAWSDFADINGNEVAAGVLKMTLSPNSQNPGDDLTFDNVKLAPGSYFEKQVYIASNSGDSTPNGRLYVDVPTVVGAENGCDSNGEESDDANCADTSGAGQLIEQAKFTVVSYLPGPNNSCTYEYVPSGVQVSKEIGYTLGGWPAQNRVELTADNTSLGSQYQARSQLTPGQGLCARLWLTLPNTNLAGVSLGNAAQGDEATFNVHFDLEQSSFAPTNQNYFSS
jgi:alternate signal-mediated exported protein